MVCAGMVTVGGSSLCLTVGFVWTSMAGEESKSPQWNEWEGIWKWDQFTNATRPSLPFGSSSCPSVHPSLGLSFMPNYNRHHHDYHHHLPTPTPPPHLALLLFAHIHTHHTTTVTIVTFTNTCHRHHLVEPWGGVKGPQK